MGEIAALSASALWATASLMFLRLGKSVSALVLNFLKCVIAVSLMFVLLLMLEGHLWPTSLSLFETGALAVSGVLGLTLGDTAYFNALNRIGPRRTLLLTAITPPATAFMAVPVLDEPITLPLLAGMVLTLGGVVWVILERHPRDVTSAPPEGGPEAPPDPDDDGWTKTELHGIAFGIGSAFCQAAGNVLTKLGGSEITALEISVVRLVFGIITLGFVIGAMGRLTRVVEPMKTPKTAGLVFVATFLGTFLGIWLMNTGLRYTYTGIAATLLSTSPIFILPLAYFFLGEKLTVRSVVGACVAVVGVAILFLG